MQTRKKFCQTCLALAAAGLGARQVFGNPGSGAKGGEEVSKTEEKKKAKIVAYCGIPCSDCPAYIATRKNDDALRRETAKKWSEMFKADIKPEDINCDGCPTDSERIFNHCRVCEIRKCAPRKESPKLRPAAPNTPAESYPRSWPRFPRPRRSWKRSGKRDNPILSLSGRTA